MDEPKGNAVMAEDPSRLPSAAPGNQPTATAKRPGRKNAKPRAKRAAKPATVTPDAKTAQPASAKEAAAAPKPAPESGFPRPQFLTLAKNLLKASQRAAKATLAMAQGQASGTPGASIDPLNIGGAFSAFATQAMADPSWLWSSQVRFWQDYLGVLQTAASRLIGGKKDDAVPPVSDKRFKDPAWTDYQIFDFLRQSYLMSARWLQSTINEARHVDERTRKRVEFFTRQFADALSPSNFLLTNPEVLRETLRTSGENLVKGLDNLLHDLKRGGGKLAIRQTDDTKFEFGKNIATAPGKVIFRNELMELLQFDPTTELVHERPLLIFPPWINKYYILDLKPENSFIRYMTQKGYTVFVASWVNPDSKLAEKTFEDYMRLGIFAGLDAVEKATGVRDPNVIGYCIGGTLLSATLGHMAVTGDDRINSATFFAAQVDFSEPGELELFIDDEQLASMEAMMRANGGYLDGQSMATTFNMLRSNDLIWSFVVNNYLMGRDPMAFDLLYWNSDATRMPIKMHMFYLRECYRHNKLARGQMMLAGKKVDLTKVTVPVFLQSSRDDHIAPYRSVFKATKLFSGPVTFMLAGSGHIAGVINHPDAKKYQHWVNDKKAATIDEWMKGATEVPGSWWPYWEKWLAPKSGKMVKARVPGDGKLKVLGDAPGTYVRMK